MEIQRKGMRIHRLYTIIGPILAIFSAVEFAFWLVLVLCVIGFRWFAVLDLILIAATAFIAVNVLFRRREYTRESYHWIMAMVLMPVIRSGALYFNCALKGSATDAQLVTFVCASVIAAVMFMYYSKVKYIFTENWEYAKGCGVVKTDYVPAAA